LLTALDNIIDNQRSYGHEVLPSMGYITLIIFNFIILLIASLLFSLIFQK